MTTGALPTTGAGSPFARGRDFILPLGIIASVLVIIVPLPTALMDVLLSSNIALAVLIVLTTIYVRTPLEFSVFPTLLLATTLSRLVLNIATTRLILTRAPHEGAQAAGHVVQAFGEFVAGNQLIVGLIIFSIVVIVQFVVITKGATRISEVAARFALDGMPGRQMAIDADLNAGVIGQPEAQRRRQEISRQADFYGAMDGASKFVRGDAIAGMLIILVNIVGGLVIGMLHGGMSFGRAAELFTKLTIGDGLVTQVPALLISLAAGLLVTRSTSETNLPDEFLRQLFSRPQALAIAGGFLVLLMFTGLPTTPMLLIGASCIGLAMTLTRQQQRSQQAEAKARKDAQPTPEQRIESFLATDPMELELGVGLVRLADPKRGGDLLQRVQRVRQQIAADLGIIMPKVRVRDNLRLEQTQFRINIAEIPVAEGTIQPGMLLAIDDGQTTRRIDGNEARELNLGIAGLWIEANRRDQAELSGYRIAEPAEVLVLRLRETVERHADEILTRDAAKYLIDELRKRSPAIVDELIPAQMKLAEVQHVLHLLLREGVSIRHLGPILETLGDWASQTKDPLKLTEYVRQRLARGICNRYLGRDGRLQVLTLDAELEQRILAATDHSDAGLQIRMPPREVHELCRLLADQIRPLTQQGRPAVVLVSPEIRPGLRQLTASRLPHLAILSYQEITRDTPVESIAIVSQPLNQPVAA